jgi:putative Mg2+ transporter-C (MgtC) family protein
MIQVNLLLGLEGKAKDSFVMLDLMRLPLGILSGMGFIGGGAILKRDNLVLGVTTAATLWFVTVIGLCFGGGQIALGVTASALGMIVLSLLKRLEDRLPQDRRGTLVLGVGSGGPTERQIISGVLAAGVVIVNMGMILDHAAERSEYRFELRWRERPGQHEPPPFLEGLAQLPGVTRLEWCPQGLPTAA